MFGILTCFFDFLSTETLTFTIPILCIFYIRNKEGRITDIKREIKQIILWMFLWLIGYAAMWGAKWLIASIVLNINSLDYVIDKAKVRVIQWDSKMLRRISKTLIENIKILYPFNYLKNTTINISIIISIIVGLFMLRKEDIKEIKKVFVILGIGIIPYIRYLVLLQHSRNHCIFTFRAQIVTILSIILAISIIIDKNKFNKEIKILKRKTNK